MRNVASIAELKKSCFAEIDKVENRKDLEKLRVKYLGREKGILTAVCTRVRPPALNAATKGNTGAAGASTNGSVILD